MSDAGPPAVEPGLVVVADDLTGACDTAAQLRRRGMAVRVYPAPGITAWHGDPFPLPEARQVAGPQGARLTEIPLFDTESRELPAGAAAERAAALGRAIRARRVRPLVYKKLDSRLRGPFTAELAALTASLDAARVILAPAFPEAGRVTRAGVQWVDGRPAHLSLDPAEQALHRGPPPAAAAEAKRMRQRAVGEAAAADPGAGTAPSHLPGLLAPVWEGTVTHFGLADVEAGADALAQALARLDGAGCPLAVIDAATRRHLDLIAAAAVQFQRVLLAGSAGLAGSLPAAYGWVPVPLRPVLVVCGSLQPATRRQLGVLVEQGGCRLFVLDVERVLAGETDEYVEKATRALGRGQDVALATAEPGGDGAGGAPAGGGPLLRRRLAAAVGALVEEVLAALAVQEQEVAGLVLTGGDTALHTLRSLAAESLTIRRELEPAVPLAALAGGPHDGLALVTKSGAIGGPDALLVAVDALKWAWREEDDG